MVRKMGIPIGTIITRSSSFVRSRNILTRRKDCIDIYAKPIPEGGDPSCFDWNGVIAVRCVGGH
eukprot:4034371-Pyramimonas_sp.AAC.1